MSEMVEPKSELDKLYSRPRYAPRPTRGEIVAASLADLTVRLRAILNGESK